MDKDGTKCCVLGVLAALSLVGLTTFAYGATDMVVSGVTDHAPRSCLVLNSTCEEVSGGASVSWAVLSGAEMGSISVVTLGSGVVCPDSSYPVNTSSPCWRFPGPGGRYSWVDRNPSRGRTIRNVGIVITVMPLLAACALAASMLRSRQRARQCIEI
jgi:hypothetical protein